MAEKVRRPRATAGLCAEESGTTAVEYAVMLGLIIVALAAMLSVSQTVLKRYWEHAEEAFASASSRGGSPGSDSGERPAPPADSG